MKNQTLKQNKDFRRLYYRGESRADSCLVTYAQKKRGGKCRFGITTSKKIGNAVNRNRARRVIRVAYQQLEPKINGSWDFVFVARSKTAHVKMDLVLEDMKKHFLSIGVIDEED